ncbi:MAG: DUF4010 domain-containing protein [Burkholderiales bacterium]|nr:DUF4010 domain-containing protein [Burkholderiales bacterium]
MALSPEGLALVLGLSFFFGLAFEEFYISNPKKRPGGVRTFPMLALAGLGLYLLDPANLVAFCVGLFILGIWLYAYYRARWADAGSSGEPGGGLIIPVCNMIAYLLGPISLTQPHWVAVSLTVSGVMLLGAKQTLHGLAQKLPAGEIVAGGKFLVLTGIVLPLLPNHPVTSLSEITPHQVWLAVVVVSTLSYASYMIRRYVSPEKGLLAASVLGGLYSSTATTVVLARQGKAGAFSRYEILAGIVLATALMYLRLCVVVAVFNLALAAVILPKMLVLFLVGMFLAWLCKRKAVGETGGEQMEMQGNPLELSAALLFAFLFVAISLASTWVRSAYGEAGIYWLASLVGVTDIDPFVLSLAQGGAGGMALAPLGAAIMVAASSNNVLKAVYAAGFLGVKASLPASLSLLFLSGLGVLLAFYGLS